LERGLDSYHQDRDRLDGSGASRLSPYLTIGVLSPRLVAARAEGVGGRGAEKWIAELLWRDFMADLLYHYPHLRTEAFDRRWQKLPWREDRDLYELWKQGRTGVPVVDAAMRELKATGWISNRARMVAAQFLVKHLLLPWQWGERLFRNWLLDGDAANNLGGWQWAAGLGVDAAPYFRVFNLETQGERHDHDGSWLNRWVPESGGSPHAHDPIVDLSEARRHYLAVAKKASKVAADVPPPLLRDGLE
jgi:deoxyribodipyrimidine photo-lyase